MMTPSDLLRRIFHPASERAQGQSGLDVVGSGKGKVPATYVSGNLPIQQPHETSTSVGTKTHPVIQIAGNRNAALIAGDPLWYHTDRNNNRVPVGKIVSVGSGITDAEYIMGLRPVAPGNTFLQGDDTEVSTNSATFQEFTNKKFQVDRKGLYRLKVELSRDGGTVEAQLVRKLRDGTVVAVTTMATVSAVHPTYGAVQTRDMTITSAWDDILYFQLRNTSGGILAYAKNVRLYYQDASASIVPYDTVLA
jgi:hypothetical protein